jgi:hypothetical protein
MDNTDVFFKLAQASLKSTVMPEGLMSKAAWT